MTGNEFQVRSRRPFPSVLALAFMLSLTGFAERTLLAAPSAVPRVSFDPGHPGVPPDVPPQVLIGEDFTFKVRFANTAGDIGYGPFIDLVLDAGGANITKNPPCACDGMTFVKANMIDVNGGPVPLVSYQSVAPPCTSSLPVSPNHPFLSSGVQPVLLSPGSQLVTIELPFGSFHPSQPEIVVEVTAHVSNLADLAPPHPLKIYARGGFRYGLDPLDNGPSGDWPLLSDVKVPGNPPSNLPSNQQTDLTQWAARAQTAPTVMIVSKRYLGPENETATGPNFIKRYELTLDIATGQTVINSTVIDFLPDNMAYHKTDSVVFSSSSSHSSPCFVIPPSQAPTPDQPNNGSLNWLTLPCASITGGAHPQPPAAPIHDATIIFEFFVPQNAADGFPILEPTSCAPVPLINGVEAEGTWLGLTPPDACDSYQVITSIMYPDPPLMAKCVAIQKSVAVMNDTGAPGPTPGDTLLYTLNFQISDFKTAGNLKIQDFISDGQTLVPGSPTLRVSDQCGPTPTTGTSGAIPSNAWTQTTACSPVGVAPGGPPIFTTLDIDVSAAMIALGSATNPPGPFRHQQGILTGGHSFTGAPLFTTPALGTITFQTVIQDKYVCPVTSPHDLFVDKDDPLTNTVTLTADILSNGGSCSTIPSAIGFTAQDDSQTAVLIPTDFLAKTVYAVVRGNTQICGPNTAPCPDKPEVLPFDQVTFRLTKTISSSDAESLTIQDWLPLPKFLVAGTTFSNTQCGIPAVGASCLGPSLPALSLTLPVVPTYSGDPSANSFTFTYGTFNDTSNQPRVIDLLFTRVVTNTPAADGLYVTNEAQESESNTFGVTLRQTAIAQVHVREPALKITKGIVAATNPNAVFSPSPAGPVAFHAVGTSCPRFSGTINSTNLASAPINSDVSNVDANDCVTFAIVVENTGGSPAYDVKLREIFPLGPTDAFECFVPDFDTMCVTDGAGTSLPFTVGIGRSLPIALQNPLPGTGSPAGSNIAVITFDACIVADIKPNCCDNVARLENYASTQGGPNFVDGGFGGPFQDPARLCVLPRATKSVTTTSEAHTTGTPLGAPLSPEQLAVGEIIRYHLDVVVPESTATSSYQLRDPLPAGLSYLGNLTVGPLPPGVTASNSTPLVTGAIGTCSGGAVTFDFGNVTNTNNNDAQEIISLEFNALVCNVSSNQNGRQINNSFSVVVAGQQVTASNTVAAIVVEPNIAIAKAAAVPSLIAGATATYTITLANNGTAAAFDVHLTDQMPFCLTNLANVQVTTAATNNSTATTLDLVIGSIPLNGTVTIHYTATVSCVDCSKLPNTAHVTWTSLPGPLGTPVNPTTSSTPGPSGSATGERNGSGGFNDYSASAKANLCCLLISKETLSCNSNGTFAYTLTVTNFSNALIGELNFSQISPANVTIPPIVDNVNPGASKTFTVTIGGPGATSGVPVCFDVDAIGAGADPCTIPIHHCVTLPHCCVQAPSGMVAWYPMDEASGASRLRDITGGNDARLFASPVGAAQAPQPVAGVVSGAMIFPKFGNGLSGARAAPSGALAAIGSADFTIDAWVKFPPSSAANKPHYIVNKFDTTQNKGYSLYLISPGITGNERLELKWGDGNTTLTDQSISPIAPDQWHHVAVTFARNVGSFALDIRLYVDGAQQGQLSGNPPTGVGSPVNFVSLEIGWQPGTVDEPITIDELEFFNRALTWLEIQSIFNAGSAGKCKCVSPPLGMVGWWPGDSNANDIADGNDGMLQGNATFAKGMVLSAFSFAAASDHVSVPSATNLNFGPAGSGGDLSIDAWIATSSSATVLPIVDKRDVPPGPFSPPAIGYTLFLFNGRLAFELGDGIFFNYISSAPDLRDGKFHHVAVTVDRTSHTGGTLYVNGNVVLQFDPTNRPASLTNDKPLFIGRHAGDPNTTFVGLIDEVEIFNRALSQVEIQGIVNAGSAGKCTSAVICVTSFQDRNGNGVQDPGESALPGATFTVTDQNGSLISTITAPACLTVLRPGNYTIREQVPPGWRPTQANPQTVTIAPGQVVKLNFAHQRVIRGRAVRH